MSDGPRIPLVVARRMYLVTEYCEGPFYMGWHAYLRESPNKQQRNANGEWGWIRWRGKRDGEHPAHAVFTALGIEMRGDGTCDDDGYARLAEILPRKRGLVGGRPRGCVPVTVDEYGRISPVVEA